MVNDSSDQLTHTLHGKYLLKIERNGILNRSVATPISNLDFRYDRSLRRASFVILPSLHELSLGVLLFPPFCL